MIKDRLVYIIPLILSLVVTIGLVRMFPLLSTEYMVKVVQYERLTEDEYRYYADLDGDGSSERLLIYYNAAGNVAVSVSKLDLRTINQFNLPGQFLTIGSVLDIQDVNSDGREDILVFTRRRDSLFLSAVTDLYGRPTTSQILFVDRLDRMNTQGDYLIISGRMSDLDQDGSAEYVFAINGGHALQPRCVYAVDFVHRKVTRSPESGAAIIGLELFDLDGDGGDEILLNTTAPNNFKASFPFSDSVSWLMVLDGSLQFYREPVRMHPGPSQVNMEPFVFKNENFLLVYQRYRGADDHASILSIYDRDLREVRSRQFLKFETTPYFITKVHGKAGITDLRVFSSARVYSVDFNLEFTDSLNNKIPYGSGVEYWIDIDRDGRDEIITFNAEELAFFDDSFAATGSVDVATESRHARVLISLIESEGEAPLLYAQIGPNTYTISYSRNGWYRYRLLVYPSIFLALFLLFCLIVVIQKGIIERKYEKDRLISKLQMQAIRNQLDPHFTYNALNAVGSLIYKEKKELAYNYLKGLTDLLRMVSDDSSEITWRLEDELGFIRKYLEIEKLRFREKFSYLIDVSSENHYKSKVPKLSILTFVENAIKHGLRHKQGIRRLEIAVSGNEKKLMIRIEDNGIGRTAAAEKAKQSGGNGIEIMEAYFRQFNEVTGKKSRFLIRDLYDARRKASGTLVEIVIE